MTRVRERCGSSILVFAVALALRVLHLIAFRRLAFYEAPFGDSLSFAREAARLLSEGPFSSALPFFQGPLYPAVLSIVRGIGLPLTATFWIQCVTGGLSAVLVAVLARRVAGERATGERTALLAGLLYAAYDAAIFFDADLLAISVVVTLVLAGLVVLQRAWMDESPGRVALVGAGIAMGLAAWGRPNLALAVAALIAWPLVRNRAAARRLLPFSVAAVIVMLIPMARNLAVSGEPVFIASGGGVNFYIGNHRGANGVFRVPPESGLINAMEIERLSLEVAAKETGRELSASEASAYWFRRGLNDLTEDVGAAARLYGRKMLLLFNRHEIPNHLDLDFVRLYSPLLRWDPVRAWLLISLGIAGLILFRKNRALSPLLVFTIAGAVSILPFFVTARFRLPLMPGLAVGAALYVDALISRGRARPTARRIVSAGLVGAAALALSLLPLVRSGDHAAAHVNLGALHADLQEVERAEMEFRRALESNPHEPRALDNLGALALRRGDPAAALPWIEQSLVADARSFRAWDHRGIALAMLGRYDEAIESFERALEIFPEWPEGRQNLGHTWQTYLAECEKVATEAGLVNLDTPEEREALTKLLSDKGFHRAAALMRKRAASDDRSGD